MPKLKTSKTVAKRFKKTASGKLKRGRSYHRHILTSKSRKRKRHLKRDALVHDGDARRIAALLPYS
ncbi:MAG: 50S ribosomal protein L35 [Candidatus Eisenbacteria bacterium]|nr:50S ribosomal protein L35 [Candidatus Eisenbacteria bacterium]